MQQDTEGKDGAVQTPDSDKVTERMAEKVVDEVTVPPEDNQQTKRQENVEMAIKEEEALLDNASHTSREEQETNSVLNEVGNLDGISETMSQQKETNENVENVIYENKEILEDRNSDKNNETDGVLNSKENEEMPEESEEDKIAEAEHVSSSNVEETDEKIDENDAVVTGSFHYYPISMYCCIARIYSPIENEHTQKTIQHLNGANGIVDESAVSVSNNFQLIVRFSFVV